jgi:hypothetical protein
MKLILTTAAAILAASLCAAAWVNAQPAPDKVTPTELLEKKDELTNKPVTVEGTLSNSGKNFFTDLRVVLKDNKDAAAGVLVQPWLPLEVPPGPAGAGPSTQTLADYLGKKVVINGALTDGVVKNVGATKVLRVDTVRVVD